MGGAAGSAASFGGCSAKGRAPAPPGWRNDMATTKTAAKPKAKPASKKPASKTARKTQRAAAKPADAIKLLKDDHKEVKGFFDQYADLEDDAEKQALADKICLALTVHAQIEEEIFYPAAREAIDDDDLLDEAEVEHASAKQLIAEIQAMKAGDRLFDAKVTVLGEYVEHHVEEEEQEMFAESRESELDLKALGAELAARKAELMAQASK
ncbi:hemerythrin superfamily protein [Sphingobium sp. B1D7B]|uniref:hemerythrin domain-containing protein n=2 Tax=Sphingobium TaxID=165695 RepID=UPI002224214F|nr:hemerythrin domain-containing protein [Sphingobium sp. B1D7B]MCW2404828.1 hemerythrin superfamily protein [Sphingobium sp. B1D7B]